VAESLGAPHIVIGVNALDYSGYPDCRRSSSRPSSRLAALATKAGVEGAPLRVHAPLISLTKAEIIRRGLELGVDYGLTHSCYDRHHGTSVRALRQLPAPCARVRRGGRARPRALAAAAAHSPRLGD